MDQMERLLGIMARLRGPGGCPWDREQTPVSLRKYVLEEAYEVADALDEGDWSTLRGELGDLLLQVVFLARIAEEEGRFSFPDVAQGIGDKLVRRHPHVFADGDARTVAEVWKRWEQIKAGEREEDPAGPGPASRLSGLPKALPALPKARLLADKAARSGFDWPDPEAVLDKLTEEIGEVRTAIRRGSESELEDEVGDLLFATACLARKLGLDPERCLEQANRKFTRRFTSVERHVTAAGQRLEELDAQTLDHYWNAAKAAE